MITQPSSLSKRYLLQAVRKHIQIRYTGSSFQLVNMPWLEDRKEDLRQARADKEKLKKQFWTIHQALQSIASTTNLLDFPDEQRQDIKKTVYLFSNSQAKLERELHRAKKTIQLYVHKMIHL